MVAGSAGREREKGGGERGREKKKKKRVRVSFVFRIFSSFPPPFPLSPPPSLLAPSHLPQICCLKLSFSFLIARFQFLMAMFSCLMARFSCLRDPASALAASSSLRRLSVEAWPEEALGTGTEPTPPPTSWFPQSPPPPPPIPEGTKGDREEFCSGRGATP